MNKQTLPQKFLRMKRRHRRGLTREIHLYRPDGDFRPRLAVMLREATYTGAIQAAAEVIANPQTPLLVAEATAKTAKAVLSCARHAAKFANNARERDTRHAEARVCQYELGRAYSALWNRFSRRRDQERAAGNTDTANHFAQSAAKYWELAQIATWPPRPR